MLCLLPLAAVALYGLGLRVGQYGWTIPDTLRRSWLTLNAWLLPLVALVGLAFTIALAARMALGFEAVAVGRRAHRLLRAVDQADQRGLAG